MEWISVKDKLPDDDVEVLVFYKYINIYSGEEKENYISTCSFNRIYGWKKDKMNVYYWMPLPEEPKND